MKLVGYASVLGLAAVLAGVGLRTRSQGKPAPSPASYSPAPATELVIQDTAADPAVSGQPTDVSASSQGSLQDPSIAVSPSEPTDRRFRRRGRNRYPGPIPTPEEWEPPDGPVRIGLQAGHWKASEAPPELSGLKENGTRWGDKSEWEVNLEIVRRAAEMLEELGYVVDVLPAVVPPGYRAHLFLSVHADGSNDSSQSGFRVGVPGRDPTGRASGFAALLKQRYAKETGLPGIPTVTHRMQYYYAFNFRRYEHALHPMTIGAILETGFLTSPKDRGVILDDPERAARGIVDAIEAFPITPPPRPGASDSAKGG